MPFVRNDLTFWRLVSRIARGDTLTEAAALEGLSIYAASRLLGKFEEESGLSPLDRRHKPARLSEDLQEVLPDVTALLDAHDRLSERLRAAREKKERTPLRLGVPANFSKASYGKWLECYARRDPSLQVELLNFRDEEDVRDGRVDAAYLCYVPNLRERDDLSFFRVFSVGAFLVASPEYLAQAGTPVSVEDLAQHTLYRRAGRFYPKATMLFSETEAYSLETGRRAKLPAGEKEARVRNASQGPSNPRLRDADVLSCYQAAVNGDGIAVDLPLRLLESDLKTGRLVAVLPHWRRLLFHNTLVVSKAIARSPARLAFLQWFAGQERRHGLARWKRWCGAFGTDGDAALTRGF